MKDQRVAAETVCDWSEEARTAEAAYALIDRALVEFETQRARPKHVSVPIAALEGLAPDFEPSDLSMDSVNGLNDAVVRDLAYHLENAQKPIFVFGGGCHSHQSYIPGEAYMRDLMKRSGAAAFSTYAGRGLIPADHPMFFGSYLARPSCAEVFAQADLVVVFGSELAEGDLWRKSLGHSCPLVRIDLDEEVLAQNVNAKAYHRCDAISFIMALNAALPEETAPKWDADVVAGGAPQVAGRG